MDAGSVGAGNHADVLDDEALVCCMVAVMAALLVYLRSCEGRTQFLLYCCLLHGMAAQDQPPQGRQTRTA